MNEQVEFERQLLKTLNIDPSEYSISQEHLPNGNSIHNLTFKHKNPNAPYLLLIHGYFSSNVSMFKLYPILRRHFNIVSIDLPGFGLSSSYGIENLKSNAEWIQYFTESNNFKPICLTSI